MHICQDLGLNVMRPGELRSLERMKSLQNSLSLDTRIGKGINNNSVYRTQYNKRPIRFLEDRGKLRHIGALV